jgi:hypothetical protein
VSFLDAVEEALDDLALADFGSASDQTRKPSSLRSAQEITTTRCRCSGRKVAAVLRPLALEGELGHLRIGQRRRQFVQRAQAGDVRNGLDVEDKNGVMGGLATRNSESRRWHDTAIL